MYLVDAIVGFIILGLVTYGMIKLIEIEAKRIQNKHNDK
jgi:large-conductance mechanosensitive channel